MNNFQTFSAVNTSISNMQRISQYHAREALDTHEDAVSVDETSINDRASTSLNHSLYKYSLLFQTPWSYSKNCILLCPVYSSLLQAP